jgi:hypothetical protein
MREKRGELHSRTAGSELCSYRLPYSYAAMRVSVLVRAGRFAPYIFVLSQSQTPEPHLRSACFPPPRASTANTNITPQGKLGMFTRLHEPLSANMSSDRRTLVWRRMRQQGLALLVPLRISPRTWLQDSRGAGTLHRTCGVKTPSQPVPT